MDAVAESPVTPGPAADPAAPPVPAAISDAPPLADPPNLAGAAARASRTSRVVFRYLNRWNMIPLHRAGLSAWIANPLTGWQCLLTTTGRKSGLERHTPLGYVIADGAAWVMAGYGPATLWYRNLVALPHVTLLLPGRPPLACRADEVLDLQIRGRLIPALARSMPLPAISLGGLPNRTPDERITAAAAWVPLIRIVSRDGTPLVAGPDDPGGHAWVWRQVVMTGLALAVVRAIRGLRSRRA